MTADPTLIVALAAIALLAAASIGLAAGRAKGRRDGNERPGGADVDAEAFRALIEQSDIPMQILSLDGGRRVFVNRAGAELFGYDSVEALAQVPPYGLVVPEARETAQKIHAELVTGERRLRHECRSLRRDGTTFPTEVHLQRVRWSGADALLIIHIDMTERHRAVEAVRQSEARLNNAQRIARFGSWEMWLDSGRLEISDEGQRMLGLERDEGGLGVEEVLARFHSDDVARVKRSRATALHSGGFYTVDYRIRGWGDAPRHVRERGEAVRDGNGRVTRLSGVVQDITELRQAQETLEEQENFYRELIEILPDTVYVHVDGKIVMANSATVEMFGAASLDDILGRSPDSLIHPDDLENIRRRRTDYWNSGHPSPYAPFRYRRLDGTSFIAESCAASITWNGKPARLIVNRNIASRLEAEQALRESEDRLKQAQRIARVGDWMHNFDSGRSLWSEELFHIFGVQPSEGARNRGQFLDMVHPDDRPALMDAIRAASDKVPTNTSEYRIVRPDGQIRHVRSTREHLPAAAGTKGAFRGITQDITEQKEIEAELRASEERFRDLVEGAPHAVVIRDMEGRRQYVNRAFLKMFRFPSLSEAQAVPRGLLSAPYDRERALGYVLSRARGEPAPDEYHLDCMRSDGACFPAQFHVRPITWLGQPAMQYTITDLTELKRAEEALRQSEQSFRDLVENAVLGMMIRRRAGQRVYVNRALADMLGYDSPDDLMSLHADAIFVAPHNKDRVRHFINRRRAGDARPADYEADCLRTDGSTFPAHFYVREMSWQGEPAVFSIVVDLTDLKRAEQEIQQLNQDLEERVERRSEELRQAQVELVKRERLATLGQLTATVSHELRNPLGSLRNSFYVVRSRLRDADSQLLSTLERIDRNITRCDRIIDELLDYTRIRHLTPSTVALDSWLAELLDEFHLPAHMALSRIFALDGAAVELDPDRLRRAVVNALENAVQALTDYRGTRDGWTPAIEVATALADGNVEIAIRDNGPGIPADLHQAVLEPLFSTKNFGIGLGLPVIQQIMQQHGGGLQIDSADDKGVALTLWFPMRQTPAVARAAGS